MRPIAVSDLLEAVFDSDGDGTPDCRDTGAYVAGGVYLYRLEGPGIERTRRMALVK